MPLSPKPAHADVVRNPKAPGLYAGWLAIGCPITTGSGTTIANIGYRTSSPWGSTFNLVNTPTWGTTAGIGDKLTFNGTNQRVTLATASGANITFPRGTIMLWLKQTSTTGVRAWMGVGSIGGTNGIRVSQVASANTLQVYHDISGTLSRFDFAFNEATFGPAVLFVSWGEQGFSARLFGASGEVAGAVGAGSPSTDTNPFITPDGTTLNLMASNAGSHTAGDLYGFAWWDWQLPDRAIEELAVDPAVWMRPTPSAVTDNVVPWPGRVTPTEATFRIVTSETLAGDGQFRILITDDWADFVTNSGYSTFTTNSTTNDAPLNLVVNSLSIGTRYYWIAQTQLDSDGWFDMPCGMGQFVAGRAPGATFDWAYGTDTHFNQGSGGIVNTQGYYRDAVNSTQNLRYSGLLEDIYLDPPDFYIHGGDDMYFDGSPSGYTDRDKIQEWVNYITPIAKSCCMYQMLGNHEREDGSFQDQTTNTEQGNQRDCTVLRKKFIPNPTATTYAEGGENDTNYLSNSGSDWVPALDGTYDATYRTNQIGNGADGNGPPLENFYGFNWGDGQWFILDPYRASQPGGTLIYTAGARFRLGNWQKAWLAANLYGSSYPHKHVMCHQFTGGVYTNASVAGDYGRGTGDHMGPHRLYVQGDTDYENTVAEANKVPGTQGDIDELWLLRLMVDTGCKLRCKGHDHQATIVSKYTLTVVGGPTCQSGLQFTYSTDFRDVFGDNRLEYANKHGKGLVFGWSGLGYIRGTITGTSAESIAVRQTYHSGTQNVNYDVSISSNINHVGPIQTGTNGTLTLDETPRKVLCVTTDEEGRYHDGTFTTAVTPAIQSNFRGTNRYTPPSQITGTNATITGNSLSDSGIPDWAQVTGPGEYITLITVGGNTAASSYKIAAVGAALTLASNPGDGTSTSWFINPLREPLTSNAVAYDDSDLEAGSQSMRIDCYPRDIYTYTLGNAIPGSIPKDGIAQATPGGSRP